MHLSLSETLKVDDTTYTILDKMSYFAYKLWNVSNYEKMNYKELGFDKFPDWIISFIKCCLLKQHKTFCLY